MDSESCVADLKQIFLHISNVRSLILCYNTTVVEPLDYGTEGGVMVSDLISAFLVSVMASVTAYYICIWLDGDDDNQPED